MAATVFLAAAARDRYTGFGTGGPADEVWFTRGADGRVNAMHVPTVRAFDVVYERKR